MSDPGGVLRVVIAEDHYLVREGVRRALADREDLEVIAAVGTAEELLRVVAADPPDAVVTDIRMPPGHATEGIDAALRIRAEHPGTGVVVLSQYVQGSYALALFAAGTDGLAYLLKERIGELDPLLAAIRAVAAGDSMIDPAVVDALVAQRSRRDRSRLSDLTDREREVLHAMAEGLTNAAIAERLHLSESAVEKHSGAIFRKLDLAEEPGVHRRVAAVVRFLQQQTDTRR